MFEGHAGDARYFHLYRFSDTDEQFVEQRKNIELGDDHPLKPGSQEMVKARAAIFKDLNVLVGKKFGPGLPNLLKKFVCVIIRVDPLAEAIQAIRGNLNSIREEYDKGEERNHLVLKP